MRWRAGLTRSSADDWGARIPVGRGIIAVFSEAMRSLHIQSRRDPWENYQIFARRSLGKSLRAGLSHFE
jgi:hypothetical protein